MLKKIVLVVVALVVLMGISILVWYNVELSPVGDDGEVYTIEIALGSGKNTIAEKLENEGVIRSALAFKIYLKLNEITNLQAGTYELTKDMSVEEIVSVLQTGKVGSDDVINITFIEGKTMTWLASKIADSTNNTEEDVYELLEDEDYIDSLIDEYWFITEEIKDEDIYYPLEGYFFPDTYQFENEDVTVEKIFETLLDKMEDVLDEYREDIESSSYSVHEILTVASIVENEAIFDKDRKDVASVIYNRLNVGMSIGSDVTTYYAFQIEIGSRDLYASEINTYNAYNTRGPNMSGKLPVGPISMVSSSSIEAAVNPNETSYLYFVADSDGNIYFTRTYDEHTQKVNELKNSGSWVEF